MIENNAFFKTAHLLKDKRAWLVILSDLSGKIKDKKTFLQIFEAKKGNATMLEKCGRFKALCGAKTDFNGDEKS